MAQVWWHVQETWRSGALRVPFIACMSIYLLYSIVPKSAFSHSIHEERCAEMVPTVTTQYRQNGKPSFYDSQIKETRWHPKCSVLCFDNSPHFIAFFCYHGQRFALADLRLAKDPGDHYSQRPQGLASLAASKHTPLVHQSSTQPPQGSKPDTSSKSAFYLDLFEHHLKPISVATPSSFGHLWLRPLLRLPSLGHPLLTV